MPVTQDTKDNQAFLRTFGKRFRRFFEKLAKFSKFKQELGALPIFYILEI